MVVEGDGGAGNEAGLWPMTRRAVVNALEHESLMVSQAAAYSAMVSLFPALIVLAAVIALRQDAEPIRGNLEHFFDRLLPSNVTEMLDRYLELSPHRARSIHGLWVASIVSLIGASSAAVVLMQGFRRAWELPRGLWGFWHRRMRAVLLVPLSVIPLFVASNLVLFGYVATAWAVRHVAPGDRMAVQLAAMATRWTVALTVSVVMIATVYTVGTPELPARHTLHAWIRQVPGAAFATAMWLGATLLFGWYVTRYANYSEIYGRVGAVVALLFWLYLVAFSVLCGAEFNAEWHRSRGWLSNKVERRPMAARAQTA